MTHLAFEKGLHASKSLEPLRAINAWPSDIIEPATLSRMPALNRPPSWFGGRWTLISEGGLPDKRTAFSLYYCIYYISTLLRVVFNVGVGKRTRLCSTNNKQATIMISGHHALSHSHSILDPSRTRTLAPRRRRQTREGSQRQKDTADTLQGGQLAGRWSLSKEDSLAYSYLSSLESWW
jgi:hypothetical protein